MQSALSTQEWTQDSSRPNDQRAWRFARLALLLVLSQTIVGTAGGAMSGTAGGVQSGTSGIASLISSQVGACGTWTTRRSFSVASSSERLALTFLLPHEKQSAAQETVSDPLCES